MKATLKWRHLLQLIVIAAALAWMGWRVREPQPIEVRIAGDGQVLVDGRMLSADELGPHVVGQAQGQSPRPVRVVVDGKAPSTVLIPVLAALERSGIENVQVVANP